MHESSTHASSIMNESSVMNETTMSSKKKKEAFSHCNHRLVYCATIFIKNAFYCVVQCESFDVFICHPERLFFIESFGVIKKKISHVAYSQRTGKLYIATSKGHIYCWDLKVEKQEEGEYLIESADGKELAGLLAFQAPEQQGDTIISFSKDGAVRMYQDNKLVSKKELGAPITNMEINKFPEGVTDLFTVIFIRGKKYPYIFDFDNLHRFLAAGSDSEEVGSQQLKDYDAAMNYDEEELNCMGDSPKVIGLSHNSALLVLVSQQIVSVYQIDKKQDRFFLQLEFIFQEDEMVEKLSLAGSDLLYQTQKGVKIYNLQSRRKIANGFSWKGTQQYNILQWSVAGRQIILGSTSSQFMKLSLKKLTLKE